MSRLVTRLRRYREPYSHQLDVDGRHIEVRPHSTWQKHTLRLSVDGEVVDESTHRFHNFFRLEGGGVKVRARSNWAGNVLRAELVRGEGDVLLAPEPGSPAAELEELARERPKAYAARHVARAVVAVLIGVLGLGALLGFLIPNIDLGVELPDIEVPDWAEIAIDSLKYVIPVGIGVALAVREHRRRRRRRELRANEAARIAAEGSSAGD